MSLRVAIALSVLTCWMWLSAQEHGPKPLHVYTLVPQANAASYDETVAVATVQGILNRDSTVLYVRSPPQRDASNPANRPDYWLAHFSRASEWLGNRPQKPVADLDALIRLAGRHLKGAIIWDPAVPATINVATTLAGVHDAVVLSPELAEQRLANRGLSVVEDLRGRFTGAETGSAKNDAYRWAIREVLARGLCSSRFVCLFHDSFDTRTGGNIGYAITRDWAVKNRAFVMDLSPWGDEPPRDELYQPLGTDLATYRMILSEVLRQSAGRHMTELTGFFAFEKYSNYNGRHASKHEPVPTEWETVHLISPFNFYQNTSSEHCYNQSLHSHAPRQPLHQNRAAKKRPLESKIYVCVLMADYDSAFVTYDYLPRYWDDPNRGKMPLAWGINPNLLDTFPDLLAHYYRTLTPADTITADAGAAGYINPSRIPEAHLPLFVEHNQRYFREADLDIAPMVLDWKSPGAAVKDAFQKFAPAGYGSMVWDVHTNRGDPVAPHVWKGMPVLRLLNEANEFPGPEKTAEIVANTLTAHGSEKPSFHFFRIVWQSPSAVIEMFRILRAKHPELEIEVLDIHTFFALATRKLEGAAPVPSSAAH